MAAQSRTAQFIRLHKILKKHYAPALPDPNRSVLEHLLFACCLENAHFRPAEEAFAAMIHTFFDWNEIRVSSTRELAEVLSGLPDPQAAATRFKRVLQSVFEATFMFDLEEIRKLNLGPAIERLEKIRGATKFAVAYLVQAALSGHSIPLDSGTMGALRVVDLASDADVAAEAVPGLERAIPKNAGAEFGSLLHQLGADFTSAPYSSALHAILLEIEPAAKERLPNRRARRAECDGSRGETPAAAPSVVPAPSTSGQPHPSAAVDEKSKKSPRKELPAESKKKGGKAKPGEPSEVSASAEPAPLAKAVEKSPKPAAEKPAAEKPAAEKPAAEKPGPSKPVLSKGTPPKPVPPKSAPPKPVAEKPAEKAKDKSRPLHGEKKAEPHAASAEVPPAKKKTAKKKPEAARGKESASGHGETASEGLSKRKPR